MKTDLVVAGYIIHNNKVLLIHHKQLDKWLPPGGHIDENEIPDKALKREIIEELNLNVEILNQTDIPFIGNTKQNLATPFHVNVHPVLDHDHCCFFYLCTAKDPENIKIEKSELKNYDWFSEQELEQQHIPKDIKHIAKKAFQIYRNL